MNWSIIQHWINLKEDRIKETNNSNKNTYFIDIYYDNKYSRYYIIPNNNDYLK